MWNKVRKYVWVVVVILAVVAIGSDIYRLVKQSKSHNEVSPTATPTVSSTPTLKPVHTPSPAPTPTHVPTPTPVLSPTVTPTGSPVGTEVTPTVTPTVTGVVMPTISITPNPREAEALESGLGPGVYYDPETGEFSTEERR